MLLDDVRLQIDLDCMFFQYDTKRPLHIASEKGYSKVVKLPTKQGCNLKQVTRKGQTPLMLALKGMFYAVELNKPTLMYEDTMIEMLCSGFDSSLDENVMKMIHYLGTG